MIEVVGVVIGATVAFSGLFKYFIDYLDDKITQSVATTEMNILAKIDMIEHCVLHCRDMRSLEISNLERRISDIEQCLHNSEVVDYIIRGKK